MLFSRSTILLLSGISAVLASPVPEPQTAPGDTLVAGAPALLDFGLEARDVNDGEFNQLFARLWSDDQKKGIQAHNTARVAKGLPKLVWDAALAADALAWAQELTKKGKLEHSSNESRPGQGENLAYSYSSSPNKTPITQGVGLWLAENKNYNNELIPQGNFARYGHYTQCMWKATKKVGIAVAQGPDGAYYTVARYSPPGNIVGQKPY